MGREGQRLMVVMPHPDDECFGCASTIARYGAEGATVSRMTVQACTLSGDPAAYELEGLALGIAPWSPSKLYFQTANTMTAESLRLPPQPPITTRISVRGFAEAKLRAFAHHRTQTQEWEPLRKFVAGQGDTEVFSLVGAFDGRSEDDLFAGVDLG